MQPAYDLDKIKFATDAPTFKKAADLYESEKVKHFEEKLNGFFATILGTKPYKVYVDRRYYDQGDCDCYLGQNETLCKHMVAVAIHAVMGGNKMSETDKGSVDGPKCSGRLGELGKEELAKIKEDISSAARYIKAYNGPSRIWFSYQNSLSEGCIRLSKIVSGLPVSGQTARLLVDLLLRLDRKICGGVDDSDGTVGGFIEETAQALEEYAKLNPACVEAFGKLKDKETCFGWEEPLLKLIKNS